MKKLIIICSVLIASCQDGNEPSPSSITNNLKGRWNVINNDHTNNMVRYCLANIRPLSANRAILEYGGCNGNQSPFCSPNDTIDFYSDGTLKIGPDTFYVFNSRIIHSGTGTYTENSMLIPNYTYRVKQGFDESYYPYSYEFNR